MHTPYGKSFNFSFVQIERISLKINYKNQKHKSNIPEILIMFKCSKDHKRLVRIHRVERKFLKLYLFDTFYCD